MKVLIALVASLAISFPAFAKDYYTCQLSSADDTGQMTLSGQITIKKSDAGAFTMDMNYSVTIVDEPGQPGETQEGAIEGVEVEDAHIDAATVLKSEEWAALQSHFNKDEQPRGAHYFATPEFKDDGAGYAVMVIHGDQRTKVSAVYIGWMPAICK
jgi:hypothetical protein